MFRPDNNDNYEISISTGRDEEDIRFTASSPRLANAIADKLLHVTSPNILKVSIVNVQNKKQDQFTYDPASRKITFQSDDYLLNKQLENSLREYRVRDISINGVDHSNKVIFNSFEHTDSYQCKPADASNFIESMLNRLTTSAQSRDSKKISEANKMVENLLRMQSLPVLDNLHEEVEKHSGNNVNFLKTLISNARQQLLKSEADRFAKEIQQPLLKALKEAGWTPGNLPKKAQEHKKYSHYKYNALEALFKDLNDLKEKVASGELTLSQASLAINKDVKTVIDLANDQQQQNKFLGLFTLPSKVVRKLETFPSRLEKMVEEGVNDNSPRVIKP